MAKISMEELSRKIKLVEEERRSKLTETERQQEDADALRKERERSERKREWEPYQGSFRRLLRSLRRQTLVVNMRRHGAFGEPREMSDVALEVVRELEDRFLSGRMTERLAFSPKQLDALCVALETKNWEAVGLPGLALQIQRGNCPYCWASPELELEKGEFRSITECPVEAGPCQVTIPIRSGVLAMGNDFLIRGQTNTAGGDSLIRNLRFVREQATFGVVVGIVHEDAVTEFQKLSDPGSFVLGRSGWSEGVCDPLPGTHVLGSEVVGGCWRCFADGATVPESSAEFPIARTSVPSGLYEFTLHELDRDHVPRDSNRAYRCISIRRVDDLPHSNIP